MRGLIRALGPCDAAAKAVRPRVAAAPMACGSWQLRDSKRAILHEPPVRRRGPRWPSVPSTTSTTSTAGAAFAWRVFSMKCTRRAPGVLLPAGAAVWRGATRAWSSSASRRACTARMRAVVRSPETTRASCSTRRCTSSASRRSRDRPASTTACELLGRAHHQRGEMPAAGQQAAAGGNPDLQRLSRRGAGDACRRAARSSRWDASRTTRRCVRSGLPARDHRVRARRRARAAARCCACSTAIIAAATTPTRGA